MPQPAMDSSDVLVPAVSENCLLVLVPGTPGDPASLHPLKAFITASLNLPSTNWVEFRYNATATSNRDCEPIARDLSAFIEQEYQARRGTLPRVVIVAHSMGTCLARRAFLNGMGYGAEVVARHEWPRHVDRFILAAAIGRGIDFKTMRSAWKWVYRPLSYIGSVLRLGVTQRQMLRGSSFISQLRIDWIRYNQTESKRPYVIHMLGTDDEVSTADDVIDVDRFDNVRSVDVVARHANIIVPHRDTEFHIKSAFGEFQTRPRRPAPGADTVVFLLHGIRDSKECFRDIDDHIKRRIANTNKTVNVIRADYGRFSLIDFISPSKIHKVVPWFSDQYTQQLARNPDATFHFGGHSNGTRVLGISLKSHPRMRFEHVYLAASPLPRDFDWDTLSDRKQFTKLRADKGSQDWPVGVVANVLNRFGFKEIGPAGQEGFQFAGVDENVFDGGHTAMFVPSNIPSIAEYLLLGSNQAIAVTKIRESGLFRLFRKYGDVLAWPLIISIGALFGGLLALPWIVNAWPMWLGPALAFFVAGVIYVVLKRV